MILHAASSEVTFNFGILVVGRGVIFKKEKFQSLVDFMFLLYSYVWLVNSSTRGMWKRLNLFKQ